MAEKVKDPVCGMELDPDEVNETIDYGGRRYSFCSPGCKTAFQQDPQRYLAR